MSGAANAEDTGETEERSDGNDDEKAGSQTQGVTTEWHINAMHRTVKWLGREPKADTGIRQICLRTYPEKQDGDGLKSAGLEVIRTLSLYRASRKGEARAVDKV